MASVINSFGILGIDGYVVTIEADTIYGQPSVNIVGLGDMAVRESKERIEAAIINAKYEFPKMKIVINLAPSDIKKSGSHFDLGMAIALLIQSKQVSVEEQARSLRSLAKGSGRSLLGPRGSFQLVEAESGNETETGHSEAKKSGKKFDNKRKTR